MLKNKLMLLMASAALAMPVAVQAQGVTPTAGGKGGTVAADQIIERYTTFAGGEANAKSLVNGLRNGAEIVLKGEAGLPTTRNIQVRLGTSPTLEEGEVAKKISSGVKCVPPLPMTMLCDIYQATKAGAPTETKFSPGAAAPMGLGNVDIALALTEATLRPNAAPGKPDAIRDNLLAILDKRVKGEGWGEIAKTYGFDLK